MPYSASSAQPVCRSWATNTQLYFARMSALRAPWYQTAPQAASSTHFCQVLAPWCSPSLLHAARSPKSYSLLNQALLHLADSCRNLHLCAKFDCSTSSALLWSQNEDCSRSYCKRYCWNSKPFDYRQVHLPMVHLIITLDSSPRGWEPHLM